MLLRLLGKVTCTTKGFQEGINLVWAWYAFSYLIAWLGRWERIYKNDQLFEKNFHYNFRAIEARDCINNVLIEVESKCVELYIKDIRTARWMMFSRYLELPSFRPLSSPNSLTEIWPNIFLFHPSIYNQIPQWLPWLI